MKKSKRSITKAHKTKGLPVTAKQLDARPDTVDFRDLMYEPTLVEVPIRITLAQYQSHYPKKKVPILDQGQEGTCTGFGLAAVGHFLLRRRKVVADVTPVSPRMFYEMARRYDEWPGEAYSGSSARGAMKGWHKHGVCTEELWPYDAAHPSGTLTYERASNGARRPLGAYFRVNHQHLVAMHSALAEVGILYATGTVHQGWSRIGADGVIPFPGDPLGGHAFAIVGYDERGFWIQNSWKDTWGKSGFALITYADWLANGSDVWVARLGAPVALDDSATKAGFTSLSARSEYSLSELRPHVISIGNDGLLRPSGPFATAKADVENIFQQDLPRIAKAWPKKRLLLYAHGGLVGEENALQRVEEYRQPLLDAHVYPLAFIWKTDFWTTMGNILKDAFARRKPEGFLDNLKDFMLDRLDDTLEPLARPLGKTIWDEMKENALRSTSLANGGAWLALAELQKRLKLDPSWEIHVAGHSAGSIFMAPVVQALCGSGRKIASVSLWAPACTMKLFHEAYLPAIRSGAVRQFNLFTLKDAAEQDDHCANIYHKSLLYLVSNACEDKAGLFFADGEPLLGMEKFIVRDPAFKTPTEKEIKQTNPSSVPIFGLPNATWLRSPNGLPDGGLDASHARHHGDFDDDKATVKATLARILGVGAIQADISFASSAVARGNRRRQINAVNR